MMPQRVYGIHSICQHTMIVTHSRYVLHVWHASVVWHGMSCTAGNVMQSTALCCTTLSMHVRVYTKEKGGISYNYIDSRRLHVWLRLETPPILINENPRLWDQWF